MAKKQLPQMPARVPQFVIDKADALVGQVKPLGHPRANREDIIAALVDAATPDQAAKALCDYNPKLGQALVDLEVGEDGSG